MAAWLALVFKAVVCGLLAAVLLLVLTGCATAPSQQEQCEQSGDGRDIAFNIMRDGPSYQLSCIVRPLERA